MIYKTKDVRLGYCCINMTLRKQKISTNRGMIKKTFEKRGFSYVSELVLKNLDDLQKILYWNYDNGILLYRMSSDIFPWMSEYEIQNLPNFDLIKSKLLSIGRYIKSSSIRVSFHPGHFNVLGSPNESAITKTIKDLNQHAEIMDLMELDQSYQYPINIHCNGTYGDKDATLARWCSNWERLNPSTRARLVIENDDKPNMYSVKDLWNGIYRKIGVPITFDYHHHRFNMGGLSEESSFELAYSTWPKNITPLFHYSSCRTTNEDESVRPQAHADYVYERINTYGKNRLHIDIEAKAKELAVLKYKEDLQDRILLENYIPL